MAYKRVATETVRLVEKWETGRTNSTGEPIVVFTVLGGERVTFQLPGQAAIDLGKSLIETGMAAIPPPKSKIS